MSYRYSDGYINAGPDGYIRISSDGYSLITSDGYNLAFFTQSGKVFDTAKGILYILSRSSAPSSLPLGGGWLYAENGDAYWYAPSGLIQSISGTRVSIAMPNANYTALQADYQSNIMEFTGTPDTNRDVILPNVSGYQWTVFNNTSVSLTYKVSGQTGVQVATTKRAIIYCNGTDIVRVTPDT